MNLMAVELTKTRKKMLALLSDGKPHSRKELHACLWDQMSPLSNIQSHICMIRKAIEGSGKAIVCEIYKSKISYRLVRLVNGAEWDNCENH